MALLSCSLKNNTHIRHQLTDDKQFFIIFIINTIQFLYNYWIVIRMLKAFIDNFKLVG